MRAMLIAVLLAAAAWFNLAGAIDITSYVYFEDKSAAMTPQEIARQPFTQVEGNVLNIGFSNSNYWIRLQSTSPVSEDLYLSITPANLAQTEAFELTGTTWEKLEKNNPTLPIDTIFKKANDTYKINGSDKSKSILLKVNSKNTVFAIFHLQNESDLINQTIEMVIRLSVFLGFLFIFCVLLFALAVYKKDIFMFAIGLWSLQLGASRLLLGGAIPPGELFDGTSAFLMLTAIGLPLTISLFVLALLQTHEIHGKLKTYATIMTAIGLAMVVFFIFNRNNLSTKLSTYWSLIPIVFLIIIPLTPEAFKHLGLPLSICIFLLGVSVVIFRSTQLGFLPAAFNSLLNPSLHIPFFVLFSVAALSKMKRTQKQTERFRKNSLQKAQQDAERERLRQTQQQKFMLMLTHELKNSLSVLRVYMQVAPAQPPYSNLAEQSITDMDAIIERCAQLDQLERDEVHLNFKNVDLKELTKQLFKQSSQTNRIQYDYQSSQQVLHTDLILLRTIINNLIDNALKYSPPQSKINLIVRDMASPLEQFSKVQGLTITVQNEVAVQDIPDTNLIFTKYYRGTVANRVSGSGLGLYIVRSMSQLIGSDLTYSCHDNYVTLKLWLPT